MTFRVLLDQNVPIVIKDFLKLRCPLWTVEHVCDLGLWGATDDVIAQWAQRNGSVVVTFDEDFADARLFPVGSHAGIIRLRVWPSTIENAELALGLLIDSISETEISGNLVIVSRRRIRARKPVRDE